jgi:hypothetical protein
MAAAVLLSAASAYGFVSLTNTKCLPVSSSQLVSSMGQDPGGKGIAQLAYELGAHNPVVACAGGLSNNFLPSIDGIKEYAVRIPDAGKAQVERLGCPVRSHSDTSNAGRVTSIHQDFKNHDVITGYYSTGGLRCWAGGTTVEAIFTAQTSRGQSEIYILFPAA